ncbi:dTMP kinase [Amycolatopsis sp. lyj-346]|uniref:dTMP kinase n=1 Tax=Amycolatopsis sp. lyj-346 TaxID=2789289 RepID=UPI003977F08F
MVVGVTLPFPRSGKDARDDLEGRHEVVGEIDLPQVVAGELAGDGSVGHPLALRSRPPSPADQLTSEILPALAEGKVVLCDRYVASSLVLQGLDDIPLDVVWALNHGAYRPDLVCALSAPPADIEYRLRARGGHSRFERTPGSSFRETYGYLAATTFLHDQGWPVRVVDCADAPRTTAGTIVDLIHRTLTESLACP